MIRNKHLVISVFLLASVAITSEFESHRLLGPLKELFRSPIKWSKKFYDLQEETLSGLVALAEHKRKLQFENPVQLEGSIVPDAENLDKSLPSFLGRTSIPHNGARQDYYFDCSCSPNGGPTCITTCTSLGVSCGQTCTNTRIYYASQTVITINNIQLVTTLVTNNCDCEKLDVICSASATVRYARLAVYAAAAVAIGVGIGVPAIAKYHEPLLLVVPPAIETVPRPTFPDDGCESNSVLFENGNFTFNFTFNFTTPNINSTISRQLNDEVCTPVLRRRPCVSPFQWVTVDVQTLQGRCTPRLCGRERVFVGRDRLCHDIDDPFECQRGRRLYYSAFGDPICDCRIGQYPFPTGNGDCVALFTQGPCPAGNVVTFSGADDNRLVCSPSQCPSLNSPGGQPFQMVPFGNTGRCYALGTRGPCPASHLLGYDVFQLIAVCVNMEDPSLPYFSTPEEDEIIDRFYNQPELNSIQLVPFQQNSLRRNGTVQRRQGSGVFQLPSRFPDSLLNPCRPGDRNNFNNKCTNPIVPNLGIRDVQRPISSPYTCQSNNFLQATGECSSDSRGASCGPSHRYNPITGQCRPIF